MLAGAAGIVVVSRLPVLPESGVLVAILACSVALVCVPWRWLRIAGCVGLGLVWGSLRGHETLARALPPTLDGSELAVRVCIEGLPQRRLGERGNLRRPDGPEPGRQGDRRL